MIWLKFCADPLRTTAVLFGCSILMMWPAIYNGYPLLFSDSAEYIQIYHYIHSLSNIEFPRAAYYRPIMYALLVGVLHTHLSLYAVIFLQSFVLVLMLYVFFKQFYKNHSCTLVMVSTIMLASLTSAPWVVSWLMPDAFTSILVLSLTTLVLAPGATLATKMLLTVIAALSISFHASHILLAIVISFIVAVAMLLYLTNYRDQIMNNFGWIIGSVAAGILVTMLSNGIFMKTIALAPHKYIFTLARLVEDGPARKLLQQKCPNAGWKLCELSRPPQSEIFTTARKLVWQENSPINRFGGPIAINEEAKEIVWLTFINYPGPVLSAAIRNTMSQLTAMSLGGAHDGDFGVGVLYWPRAVLTWVAPTDLPELNKSRQAAGNFNSMGQVKIINLVTIVLSISVTIVAAVFSKDSRLRFCCFMFLCVWVANAGICGALSEVTDRYNMRITWLFVLPSILFIIELYSRFNFNASAKSANP